jgi:hypothetical protein
VSTIIKVAHLAAKGTVPFLLTQKSGQSLLYDWPEAQAPRLSWPFFLRGLDANAANIHKITHKILLL